MPWACMNLIQDWSSVRMPVFSRGFCLILRCSDRDDTQPSRSRMENVAEDSRTIIGGSKAGNQAWGLAYIDTVMEPSPNPADKERERLLKESEGQT